MIIEPFQKRTWAEIDIDAIKYNFEQVKNNVGKAKVCCVIKANGYGHGAVPLAHIYEELGADFFAVSNIEEALQLRNNSIKKPILILGYTDPQCAEVLAKNQISQCVYSEEYGEKLSENAMRSGVNVRIHIKLDTGMGRIGFSTKKNDLLVVESIVKVCLLPGLIREGIFTHFASADEGIAGEDYTHKQFENFCNVIEDLKMHNIEFDIRHCANSAAIFDYPEMHLDMVRAGVVLYGLQPSEKLINKVKLKQAMTLHSVISHIKNVNKGECISYGRTYVAKSDRIIATIPVGYADGLWRSNVKNGIAVKVNGKFAPVIGRICMDQCMLDISGISGVQVGASVIVYGLDQENCIDKIAKKNSTINYEIVCALGERVTRVYTNSGEISIISDNIVRK